MTRYHLTPQSGNRKTGPIAVSTTSADTCPPSCPLSGKGGACYAGGGPLAMHWRAVTAGKRGGTLAQLCRALRALPAGSMFRHNQAGDLPGRGERVNRGELAQLQAASAHLQAWTYTHKRDWPALRAANAAPGMTVNLSADDLAEADALADTGAGPVCTVLQSTARKGIKTPAGRTVAICPAQLSESVSCSTCGNGRPLCARRDRNFIVGFLAHGARAGIIDRAAAAAQKGAGS